MLSIAQNFLGPRVNPIGITFGAEKLRVAQVREQRGELSIAAAASRDVPASVRDDPRLRPEFFATAIREIVGTGGFKGRQVVLGLPASSLAMLHLRLPPMEPEVIRKAVLFESMGKLPFHPSQAMIRHIVAGEVYDKQELKFETIVMASPKAAVEEYLAAAAKAKMDVVGLAAEPLAMVECFTRLGQRKEDTQSVTCYLDIGASGTRVLIALGRRVLFARSVGVGGDEFTRAYAKETGVNFADARLTRQRVGAEDALAEEIQTSVEDPEAALRAAVAREAEAAAPIADVDHTFAFPASVKERSPALPAAALTMEAGVMGESQRAMQRVLSAIRQPLDRLVSEVEMCRRYHDATFPPLPVQRIVFAGGEGKQRSMCASIAQRLGLPASVWDPVSRLPKDLEHAMELGLNPKNRLPEWAVVVGLSMGVKE